MTIIVGTKYAKGIIVGYDTVSLIRNENKYIPNRYAHKFIKIGNTPFGVGLSGLVDEEYFTSIREEIKNNNNIFQSIKLLRAMGADCYESIFFPQLKNTFIFGNHEGLITDDDSVCHNTEVREYAGIGLGYYPAVEKFLRQNHNSLASCKQSIELIKNSIELSKSENLKDPKYSKGAIIKGLGIVRITKDSFDVLEFSIN